MKNLREILVGLFTAMASIIIVFGALSLSAAENQVGVIPVVNSPTATEVVVATPTSPAALLSEKTLIVETNRTATPKPAKTETPITSPTSIATENCQPPENWNTYTIHAGDTLNPCLHPIRSASSSSKKPTVSSATPSCLARSCMCRQPMQPLPPPCSQLPRPSSAVHRPTAGRPIP